MLCLLGVASTAGAGNAWGDVKGRVVWAGKEIPKRQPIAAVKANADKKHCLQNGPILDERWVVDPNDYLKPQVYDPQDNRWAKAHAGNNGVGTCQ